MYSRLYLQGPCLPSKTMFTFKNSTHLNVPPLFKGSTYLYPEGLPTVEYPTYEWVKFLHQCDCLGRLVWRANYVNWRGKASMAAKPPCLRLRPPALKRDIGSSKIRQIQKDHNSTTRNIPYLRAYWSKKLLTYAFEMAKSVFFYPNAGNIILP